MTKTTPKKIYNKLSVLGNRPEEVGLRLANFIFFALAMFFGVVYFTVASTQEIADNAGILEDSVTYLLMAVLALSLALALMEFYNSLSSMLRVFRLLCVLGLAVVIGLAIPRIRDIGTGADGNADEAQVFVFASLTAGFAGIAAILNVVEVMRNY